MLLTVWNVWIFFSNLSKKSCTQCPHGIQTYGRGWGEGLNKYHSFSDISQNNDTCVSVVPVIVVISGLAYFQWYLRAHLQCFVYLCVEISGSRKKKTLTYYLEVKLKQNTQENKTNKQKNYE